MRISAITIGILLFGLLNSPVFGQRRSSYIPGSTRKLCPPMSNVPQPAARVNTAIRLANLRAEMRKVTSVSGPPLDAYIITSHDAHQSGFVAERDKRLQYISGFSGSYGLAVVTMTKAAIWVPGLYMLQANEELSCDWLLMGTSPVDVTVEDWLKDELGNGGRVGGDPSLLPNSLWDNLAGHLANYSIYLFPVKNNLVDFIWTPRPSYTRHEATIWPIEYAGKNWQTKVSTVRGRMKVEGCDAFIITALDEIAWLLNIRGRDIPYLPVLRSYVILSKDQIHLYTEVTKLGSNLRRHLHSEGCFSPYCARIHSYDSFWDDLKSFTQIWKAVCLPSESPFSPGVSRAVFQTIPVEKRRSLRSPIAELKVQKNSIERLGMHRAHVRDAAAVCDFMAYLEQKLDLGERWDELTVANNLDQFRREQHLHQGISFTTVAAFAAHGAWPHYEPSNATKVRVDNTSLLVIDSGGHYEDGTTDVTRTFHLGYPNREQREAYTRVLMGLIDVASLVFPQTLPMNRVDSLARAPLWQIGIDYQHGTGHGIGVYNTVHEGPILISPTHDTKEPFKDGYFFSVEPGYYKEDKFGIRLENIFEVVEKNFSHSVMGVAYFGFNPTTLVPFEPKLIDVNLLSPLQIQWLNAYNRQIRNEVGAELKKQMRMKGFYWMMEKAVHIPENCHLRGNSLSLHPNTPILTLFTTLLTIYYVQFG